MSGDTNANLVVQPANELKFKGPFSSVVTSHLFLKNISSKVMCYKVKTTAPKMYCVRPNSGLIDPGKEVDISVMLQPFDFNTSEKMKHKFLIQSTLVNEKLDDIDQIWKSVNKEEINEIKLKCVFEGDQPQTETQTSSVVEEKSGLNVSNNAQAGLVSSVEEMKRQLDDLRNENNRLKENEVRLRKLALQDSVENSQLPQIVDHSKQANNSNMVLMMILCLISFLIGLIISKVAL